MSHIQNPTHGIGIKLILSTGINEATPAKVNDDVFLEEFIVVTLRQLHFPALLIIILCPKKSVVLPYNIYVPLIIAAVPRQSCS